MEFNEQQRAVINAVDGVYVVISGPGSGKSTCLIERFLGMISKGISQKDILNLTFTNAAASELVARAGILNAESVFRTFHSFALDFIRKEQAHLPFKLGETILPFKGEDYQLLFELVRAYPAIPSFRALRDKISEYKNSNIRPEQAISEAIGVEYYLAQAYASYEERCRESGWLDFDGLIEETVKLLETNEEVRSRWKKRYIAVDEFQDTSFRELRLIELLFDGNLMCVGDPNQSLYEFRGAHPDTLKYVYRNFPDPKTLFLGVNYRSSKKIVSFIQEVLPVDNGIKLSTDNEDGVDPIFIRYPDTETEIQQVLSKAIVVPEDSVILARTNRQLYDVQRIAASRGIKYRNLGKKDYFDQAEIKALLTFCKDAPQHSNAADTLQAIIRDHNLYNRYRNSGDSMYNDPIENMTNLVKMAAGKGTVQEFLIWAKRATYGRKSRKEKDLTLSTVHQFKGRQAKHVYLIGCEQGRLPHKEGTTAEEARVFYVGVSRAAETLQISWSGSRSMFIPESRIQDIKEFTE